jgi:hypothetical protein
MNGTVLFVFIAGFLFQHQSSRLVFKQYLSGQGPENLLALENRHRHFEVRWRLGGQGGKFELRNIFRALLLSVCDQGKPVCTSCSKGSGFALLITFVGTTVLSIATLQLAKGF